MQVQGSLEGDTSRKVAEAVLPVSAGEDGRFRALVGPSAWASLPAAVRRRFSKRVEPGDAVVYTGRVVVCKFNRAGWCLAQALRLIGAPLPLSGLTGTATTVSVTVDAASRGQNWTRVHVRANGFPQVIHSTKRFAGPTGLEEYVGWGISMPLFLTVEDRALVFSSARYFVSVFGRRWRLPRWLEPGRTVVTHRATTSGRFLFMLDLRHPLFGTLVHQEAFYEDVRACADVLS